MLQILKDVFAHAQERVRSPIYGCIAVVFIIANWDAILILLFEQSDLLVRLALFEQRTSVWTLYFIPALGVSLPFLRELIEISGDRIMARPRRAAETSDANRRKHKANSDHDVAKHLDLLRKNEIDALSERVKAADAVGDPKVASKLKEQIAQDIDPNPDTVAVLARNIGMNAPLRNLLGYLSLYAGAVQLREQQGQVVHFHQDGSKTIVPITFPEGYPFGRAMVRLRANGAVAVRRGGVVVTRLGHMAIQRADKRYPRSEDNAAEWQKLEDIAARHSQVTEKQQQ